MKVINKLIKVIDKIINLIVLTFFIICFLFGIYAIIDAYTVYDSAKLSDDIISLRPNDYIEDNSDDNNMEESKIKFSLDPLYEINKEICAWIRISGTNIDYPIVKGKDNTEYINRNYKKEYATGGSIFLDYRNDKDFQDDYSIIYGHNMKSGAMFSDIKKFEDADFFNSHDSGILYTNSIDYKIDVICVAKVNAFSNETYNLMVYKNGKTDEIENLITEKAIFKRNLDYSKNDKLLLLSTCSSSGSSERLVLLVRLRNSSNENLTINENISNQTEKDENQSINNGEKNNDSNVIAKKEEKNKFNFNISARGLAIIILLIIVIIIFSIVIIQRVILIIKNKKNNEK